MSRLYLLDTNIASAAIRGSSAVDDKLQYLAESAWAISAITRAELQYGVQRKPEAEALRRRIDAFLRAATVLPWDAAAADMHGAVRAQLYARGRPIGPYDEMLAAHAMALGATMVTNNLKHFSQVPGLLVEDWLAA